MDFLHSGLGHLDDGSAVEVALRGTAANVLLLDPTNFSRYQQGADFSYYGGHFTQSPAVVSVPHAAIGMPSLIWGAQWVASRHHSASWRTAEPSDHMAPKPDATATLGA